MRREVKRKIKYFTDHIDAILKEGLGESESDEKNTLKEVSQHQAELKDYQRNLECVIEKLECLTKLSSTGNKVLTWSSSYYFPDTVTTTDLAFTAGQCDTIQNEGQFGQMTKC